MSFTWISAVLLRRAPQLIQRLRLLRVKPPETWRGRGRSESLPRTPFHIWCTHRRAIFSEGGQGEQCGAVWVRPRERSGCRDPTLKGGPSDTEGHTWGVQRSCWRSGCHQASLLPVDEACVVWGQCCPGPAEILQAKHKKVNTTLTEVLTARVKTHT